MKAVPFEGLFKSNKMKLYFTNFNIAIIIIIIIIISIIIIIIIIIIIAIAIIIIYATVSACLRLAILTCSK